MRFLLLCLLLALSAAPLRAAGDEPVVSRNPDFLKGVQAVDKEDFRAAITLFNKVVAAEPNDANAHNYLGYSHRKLGEMDAALEHYYKALSIDPDHKGANEYIGQAYLALGQLDKAKMQLGKLDKICWLGCTEYTRLKKAIRDYEAKGKS